MKKSGVMLGAVAIALCCRFQPASGQNDLGIWKESEAALKGGTLSLDRIKPLYGVPKEELMRHLLERKEIADRYSFWPERNSPEVFPVGNLGHFVVTLSVGGGMKSDCCFYFRKEGDRWFYGHLENIFIRLDKTPAPPTSDFPDVSPETKAWQREEIYWSEVRLQTHFFVLYKRASHLKQWIPFDDYRRIFESIWQDRARAAGWILDIRYEDPECLKCVFHFTKKQGP